MKKLAALLALTMTLSVALVGCGGDDEAYEDDESENIPVESQEPDTDEQEVELEAGDRGTGLVAPSMESALDENPNRAVRRSGTPVGFRPALTIGGGTLGEEHYYYRNTLNDKGKQAYDQIRAGILEAKAQINMNIGLSVDDAFKVYQMVIMDGPELFYANNALSVSYNNYGVVTTITPKYNDLVYDIPGNTQRLQNSVAQAVADMRALGEPLYQVKYAHDYLTNINDYVSGSSYNQNCFSSLVLGQTVCAGYAHGMQYLMQQVNIPCAYVVGFAGESHAWNILNIYGETYAMDVTWDDPLSNPPTTYYYNYFNITDDQMARDHTRDEIAQPLPWATGTACNYQNGFGGNAPGTDFAAIGAGNQPVPVPDTVPQPEPQPNQGDNWWDDTNWDEPDWNDDTQWWDDTSENADDAGEWWNLLDPNWTQSDWTQCDDGVWEIWDEETQLWYSWYPDEGIYGCMDENTGEFFWLDMESGEWLPME